MAKRKKFYSGSPKFTDEEATSIGIFLEKKFPDGHITVDGVYQLAKNRMTPLYKYIEWNDKKAAESYRKNQVRELIGCVVVVEEGQQIRNWCPAIRISGQSTYVELNQARQTPEIWEEILRVALKEANQWRDRYKRYSQLKPIFSAIDVVNKGAKR